MYVCICKGITDRDIREAVDSGANSFRKVRNALGVSTQCGKCACQAKEIVKESIGDSAYLDQSLFYAAN